MIKEFDSGAIIFRREDSHIKYLLLHYPQGHWGIVKGHKEGNETDIETLLRETQEETGIIDLKILPDFREKMSYHHSEDGKSYFKEVVIFVAETKTKDVKLSFEHTDFAWLNYDDALKRITYDNTREMLKKANDYLKENLN